MCALRRQHSSYPTCLAPVRSPVHLTMNWIKITRIHDTLNLHDTIYLRSYVECWGKHNNRTNEKSKSTVWKTDGWKNTRNKRNHNNLHMYLHSTSLLQSSLSSYEAISLSTHARIQERNRARDAYTFEDTQMETERKARHIWMKKPSEERETAWQSEGYREIVKRERDGMWDAKRRGVSYSLHYHLHITLSHHPPLLTHLLTLHTHTHRERGMAPTHSHMHTPHSHADEHTLHSPSHHHATLPSLHSPHSPLHLSIIRLFSSRQKGWTPYLIRDEI